MTNSTRCSCIRDIFIINHIKKICNGIMQSCNSLLSSRYILRLGSIKAVSHRIRHVKHEHNVSRNRYACSKLSTSYIGFQPKVTLCVFII